MEIIFFLYPLQSPAHCGPEIIAQSIFPNKLTFLYIFKNKKKLGQVYIGISILVIPDHIYILTKILHVCNIN